MVEAAGYAGLLTAANWLYWLIAALVLWWAWRKPAARRDKMVAVTLVAVLFLAVPAVRIYHFASYKWKYNQAKVLFDERCKTAGEKIYRTVDNVDRVLLLKIRPQYQDSFGRDPMYAGAALIDERGGDGYIASFLRYEKADSTNPNRRGELSDRPTSLPGYRAVEVIDSTDGRRYIYKNVYGPNNLPPAEYMPIPKLDKVLSQGVPARFAVTYKDLVNPEDRKHWVAGTVLQVVDTQTNEVIAEQTRFLFDTGLGNTNGGRNPWGWASSYVPSCPRAIGSLGAATRYFVDQVLRPIKGE